ncbi:MAG: discoidin domain-containing protein [Bacteroidales bacterium]|nr:discoidin domain-containing protein [Bacteroidales bacterium]
MEIKAIAHDPASGKISPVGSEKFDISKKNWKILGTTDENASSVLDGSTSTTWHQRNKSLPTDLVIDLGGKYNLCGFKYIPDQAKWSSGIISHYEFYVSDDNAHWKLMDKGEFSNITNNPVLQIKNFKPDEARYIRLRV